MTTMEIVMEYTNGISKRDRYNLMTGTGHNLQEYAGQRIGIKAFMLIATPDSDGEIVRRLKVLTDDGEIVGTASRPFIEGFVAFVECMGADEATEMEIEQRTSKAGRRYLAFKA